MCITVDAQLRNESQTKSLHHFYSSKSQRAAVVVVVVDSNSKVLEMFFFSFVIFVLVLYILLFCDVELTVVNSEDGGKNSQMFAILRFVMSCNSEQ